MSLSDKGMTRNLPSDARLELNGARVDVQLGLDECEGGILQAGSRTLGQRVVDPIAERLEYAIMSVIFADMLKSISANRTHLKGRRGMESFQLEITPDLPQTVGRMFRGGRPGCAKGRRGKEHGEKDRRKELC